MEGAFSFVQASSFPISTHLYVHVYSYVDSQLLWLFERIMPRDVVFGVQCIVDVTRSYECAVLVRLKASNGLLLCMLMRHRFHQLLVTCSSICLALQLERMLWNLVKYFLCNVRAFIYRVLLGEYLIDCATFSVSYVIYCKLPNIELPSIKEKTVSHYFGFLYGESIFSN